MSVPEPGQRIALVHTDDPYTALQPGDTGTVRRYDPDQNMVAVAWDSGSNLSMCLDAGDRIRPLPATPITEAAEPRLRADAWRTPPPADRS